MGFTLLQGKKWWGRDETRKAKWWQCLKLGEGYMEAYWLYFSVCLKFFTIKNKKQQKINRDKYINETKRSTVLIKGTKWEIPRLIFSLTKGVSIFRFPPIIKNYTFLSTKLIFK